MLTNVRRHTQTQQRRGEINYKLGTNLYGLTEREMEVLALIVDGLTNPQIADKLVITISTTKTHVTAFFKNCMLAHVPKQFFANMPLHKEGLL